MFDRTGNIGPTLWWEGEIVGAWAITSEGELRTQLIADRGAEAHDAIEHAASRLHKRLHGVAVTPSVRTALERSLARDAAEPKA